MAPSKKTMLFVCLLVAAVAVVVPVVQGTVDLGGLPSPLVAVLRIRGFIYCSANLSFNGTSPPLVNATVQLRCGAGNGSVVASVQTNNLGFYSILVDPFSIPLTQLLSGCRVVVVTPVAGCTATLPVGALLSSALSLAETTFIGVVPVINVRTSTTGFTVNLGA